MTRSWKRRLAAAGVASVHKISGLISDQSASFERGEGRVGEFSTHTFLNGVDRPQREDLVFSNGTVEEKGYWTRHEDTYPDNSCCYDNKYFYVVYDDVTCIAIECDGITRVWGNFEVYEKHLKEKQKG